MNNEEKNFIRLTPFKLQVIQSFPFIDADFDALTNYEVLCKVVDYLNKTVDNVNLLNDNFNTLYNYVHDYFDNLDVQEEINNKLDEMAESGELTDIIAQYLGLAGVLVFDTVSDMKLGENLVNGSICKTLGYTSISDNGGAFYKVRTITNEDIVNEENIIALYDNTLIAELVLNEYITPEMFGCVGDGVVDDTEKLQDVIDYSVSEKIKLVSRKDKKYKVTDTIVIDGVFEGNFENAEINANFNDDIVQIKVTDNQGYDQDKEIYYSFGGYLKNLIINGNGQGKGINLIGQKKMTIQNIEIVNCDIGLHAHSATECVIDTIRFQKCDIGLKNEASDVKYTNIFGRFCNIGMDLIPYSEVINSHFWVREDEDEFTDSIYAKVTAGALLENVQIDSYQTGIKLLGNGSYPLMISGRWQQPNTSTETYTLFDVTSPSYNATGAGIRMYNFSAIGKETAPTPLFSNVEADVFGGEIDYASCRFVRIDNFPLTTHTKLVNLSTKISATQNRVNIDGFRVHVQLMFKVTEAFKDATVAELPVMQSLGVPIVGKSFLAVTSAQYSISHTEQLIGGFVSRNNSIKIYTLDNNDIPVNTYVNIEFDYVAESRVNLTE